MPLPTPNLDDRRFQDILDEARRLIPRYCPTWTDHNLSVYGPRLRYLLACRDDVRFNDYMPELRSPQRPGIFADPPRPKDRLYFGFANDLGAHTLVLNMDCPVEGVGVDPRNPPLVWE